MVGVLIRRINVGLESAEVNQRVEAAKSIVPYAIGMNNQYGQCRDF